MTALKIYPGPFNQWLLLVLAVLGVVGTVTSALTGSVMALLPLTMTVAAVVVWLIYYRDLRSKPWMVLHADHITIPHEWYKPIPWDTIVSIKPYHQGVERAFDPDPTARELGASEEDDLGAPSVSKIHFSFMTMDIRFDLVAVMKEMLKASRTEREELLKEVQQRFN
jgi:hypothetical protein